MKVKHKSVFSDALFFHSFSEWLYFGVCASPCNNMKTNFQEDNKIRGTSTSVQRVLRFKHERTKTICSTYVHTPNSQRHGANILGTFAVDVFSVFYLYLYSTRESKCFCSGRRQLFPRREDLKTHHIYLRWSRLCRPFLNQSRLGWRAVFQ